MKTTSIDMIELIVLDDELSEEISNSIRLGLIKLSWQEFHGLNIVVSAYNEVDKMIKHFEEVRWRFVKYILIDYELKDINNDAVWQKPFGSDLVELIKKFNPSIETWGMSSYDPLQIENSNDDKLKSFAYNHNIKGLIDKSRFKDEENTIIEIRRFLINSIEAKFKTPFFDSFKKYVEKASKSWHVPGHNRGQALKNSPYANEFYNFFGENSFLADHDVPKELGSIFTNDNQNNIIGETQELIAQTFNAKKTFLITNGNSAANITIILALLRPSDNVLVARSCHKSVHYAIVLSGANPTYLTSVFSDKYEIMAPPSYYDIKAKLKAKKNGFYKLLIVTGCSYEGLVMDIDRLNDLTKDHGTELFVDEAWYGYSNFHPLYQKTSATRLNVPYVTQSAHKMLSAFRQSAFIHINSPKIDLEFLKDIYNTFTSTSPQYQLIASMDVAAMQMRMEGYELIDRTLERAYLFKNEFKKMGFMKIKLIEWDDLKIEFAKNSFDFDSEGIFLDPLKISFDISETGIEVKKAFNFIKKEAGVDLIKSTKNCIQILFTIGTSFDRNKPTDFLNALKKLEDDLAVDAKIDKSISPIIDEITYENRLPRDFFYAERKLARIEDALNKRSATLVTPYPPGIPILLPGEIIKKSHIDYLKQVMEIGHISVHGLKNGKIYTTHD